MVIQTVVNSIDVTASAGVGVAEKVCAFIMLVPSAFSYDIMNSINLVKKGNVTWLK